MRVGSFPQKLVQNTVKASKEKIKWFKGIKKWVSP